MSLSLQARFWRFILRKTIKEPRLTIPQHRAQAAKTARLAGRVPQDVTIDELKIEGLRAAWFRPTGADNDLVFLYLHGGGYVTGSIDSYRMMCIPLAQTLKMNLLLPEYRLAPEHPFPAALEDVLAIYRWLLAQGHQSRNIVICGDSAGGGLTLAAILALREGGEPLPGAAIFLSPWADLTHQGQSHLTKAKSEVMLKTDELKEWALCYTDAANLTNPLVSPVYADFRGFPPLLIQVGSEEILLDDARAVAEKAKAVGVDVTLKVWDDMWHVWPALGGLLPESRQSFEQIGQFIVHYLKTD